MRFFSSYYGARYYNSWLSVDPIALYDPIDEVEHYLDGQHNGGYFNPRNTSVYGYTYQNPIIYVDPNGKQSWSKALDWVKQKTEEVKQKTIKKVENLKQNVVKTLSTTDGRNKVLNSTRDAADFTQKGSLVTMAGGVVVTGVGLVVPPLIPIGLSIVGGSATANFYASGVEAVTDISQAINNNNDFQDGKAFTSTLNVAVGEGLDLIGKKLGGSAGEKAVSPLKKVVQEKLIPQTYSFLSGEIIKQESGYKPPAKPELKTKENP